MSPAELARYEKGLSVDEAAKAAGISSRTIRRIESGEVKPTPGTARALAQVYGVSVATLLGLTPLPRPEAA